ncbi:MAG: lysylphosphatidylglycerol synthase transmembrane domain-containing protein [Pseudomonadota bacterium]
MTEAPRADLIARFRRWLAWGLAVAVLLYLVGSIYAGIGAVGAALARFSWWMLPPVIVLVLGNYLLRFFKWHFFVRRLGVRVKLKDNLLIFAAGLAMVISPGKAGEVLKPYLLKARTGANMATSIPALVAERLTDGIAMLALAALSVSTYAGDKVHYIVIPAAVVVAGMGVLAWKRLSLAILGLVCRLPVLARVGHKLEEMYLATRTCLAPVPLVGAVVVSLVAWWLECVAYWLIFRGFDVPASLDVSTFLYAFATVAGGAMPGGLGVADGALGGGALTLIPGITEAQAVASALLIRITTLWMGVGIGAVALLRVGSLLAGADPTAPSEEA